MRLIIGGRAAGKLDYVRSLGYSENQIFDAGVSPAEEGRNFPVYYRLHEAVRSLMKQKKDPAQTLLALLNNDRVQVVVCDEVGGGIVPLDRFEREYREAVGRICCVLAKRADIVERVYCGIPTVIKSHET